MITSAGWIFGVMVAGLVGPDGVQSRYEFSETHMGSEFRIILYSLDATSARRASRAAFDRIAALDATMSDYQPDSELMRLCDRAGGPPVRVSEDLFDILQRSRSMYERTGGAFDVTVGPVVRLWRRARRDRRLPAAETLARARSLVSTDLMTLDVTNHTVRLAKPGMKLDLGGIAKGYASQEALKVLSRQGVTRALVAGAGDIVAGDPPPFSEAWTIAVAALDAASKSPERLLSVRNAAVSTAGDTERFVEIGGRRYSHIVDPRTGIGVVDRCTVTVIAPDGATADALDTAVYAMGADRGLPIVEATDGAAALILRETPAGRRVYESLRLPAFSHAAQAPDARVSPR
jgi:thiamine biosynthesis lipoprotein